MKRFVWLILFAGCLAPAGFAQDHVQIGAYGDYFHMKQTGTNFAGLGARVGINSSPAIAWEAEMSYDFGQAFHETFTNGATVNFQNSDLRVLHGLFGPKFQIPHGPLRLFVTAKGGFVDFLFDQTPAGFSSFTSSVQGLRTSNVSGVFYPGAGVEGRIGPVGLRLDVGDEIYFNHGTYNNLRISFGPTITF